MHVAIVGAGFAGLAAAVELASSGLRVTVFEASRTLGGRARRVEIHGHPLDNGQHILVGAYTELLRVMRLAGANPDELLARKPLELLFPGHMRLRAPRLPAPLHLAAALITAQGIPLAGRIAALRFMRNMKARRFRLDNDMGFKQLMELHGQHASVRRFVWEPLCVSALNTPPGDASAQVFLNVLRDSLAGKREASDLLLPRADLSALFPEPAERFVMAHGGQVLRGTTIKTVTWDPYGFRLQDDPTRRSYTHVIAAVAPYHLAAVAARLPRLKPTLDRIAALDYEPILTAYLAYPQALRLPKEMVGLSGGTAHFLFQHSERIVSAVTSASGSHLDLARDQLIERVHRDVESVAGSLPLPEWSQVIVEKRATFACRPGVVRPLCETPLANFFVCGDYVASDYPATLESAVRSGVACARLIAKSVRATGVTTIPALHSSA